VNHIRQSIQRAMLLAACTAVEHVAAKWSPVPRPGAVTARAVASVDVATGGMVLAKAPDRRLPPASTVKLATALLLTRLGPDALDETITIEPGDCIRGSRMGLESGDIISYRDLLYGLLLVSGNDAAQVIARGVGAGLLGAAVHPITRFVQCLNQLGAELGLQRTRFVNPVVCQSQGSTRLLATLPGWGWRPSPILSSDMWRARGEPRSRSPAQTRVSSSCDRRWT
jgi:D-alanyl-D-alanine carboxypeptidase